MSLVRADDSGVVTLRLEGSCDGCASSAATLKLSVEEAVYTAAPDVAAIIVEGSTQGESPTIGFVPLSQLGGNGHEAKAETESTLQRSGI